MEQLISVLISFIFGTLGAGFFSFYQRKRFARIDERIEAEKKLKKYANRLWITLHELTYRLNHILDKLNEENPAALGSLQLSVKQENPIQWYAQEGYYLTSTAYLLASLSAWMGIYQRDVVNLDFKAASDAARFFKLTEALKQSITNTGKGSVMWYFYFESVGTSILDKEQSRPLDYSQYVQKLKDDQSFQDYMQQAFQFIHHLTNPDRKVLIEEIIARVQKTKAFLENNLEIPIR